MKAKEQKEEKDETELICEDKEIRWRQKVINRRGSIKYCSLEDESWKRRRTLKEIGNNNWQQ